MPSSIYRHKNSLQFRAGIPDYWYSANKNDLWVEYKKLPKTPVKQFTPKLTPLQIRWLSKRHDEGRNVAVIVGFPGNDGMVLRDKSWEQTVEVGDIRSVQQLGSWITEETLDDQHH